MQRGRPMKIDRTAIKIHEITYTAISAAVLCMLGPLTFPLPFSPVPVSMIQIGLYMSVFILGTKMALLSLATYMLLGMVGVPVFAGFSGGPAVLAGPTGGYIVGYFFLVFISGIFIDRKHGNLSCFLGMTAGALVCCAFGTAWLAVSTARTFYEAFLIGAAPYIVPDTAKAVLSLAIGKRAAALLCRPRK